MRLKASWVLPHTGIDESPMYVCMNGDVGVRVVEGGNRDEVGTWTAAYAIIRGVTSVMLHRLRTSIGPLAFVFGS